MAACLGGTVADDRKQKCQDLDFIESVGETITWFMSSRGYDDADAIALAAAVKESIADQYQGDLVKIRKVSKHKRHRRAIRAEYNGRNMSEICRKYRVSRATVYRCLK